MGISFSGKCVAEQQAIFNSIILSSEPRQRILENFDEIVRIIPELKEMKGFNQNNRYHIYDVLTHTLVVVENTEADLVLRLSALFHDIGKPRTYTEDASGNGHFYGHDDVSVKITRDVLTRLDYCEYIKNDVLELIKFHDYPLQVNEKILKRLANKINLHLIDKLFQLKRADCLGQNPSFSSRLQLIEDAYEMMKKLS